VRQQRGILGSSDKSLDLIMETVIMNPENKEQLSALKAFAKALKVKFETILTITSLLPRYVKARWRLNKACNYIRSYQILVGKYRIIVFTIAMLQA